MQEYFPVLMSKEESVLIWGLNTVNALLILESEHVLISMSNHLLPVCLIISNLKRTSVAILFPINIYKFHS